MTDLWLIIVSTVLVNNLVLTQFLGLDEAFTATRSLRPALLHAAATSVVLLVAGLALWPVQWLVGDGAAYLPLLLLIDVLVIAMVAMVVDQVAREFSPVYHRALGHHLPLLFTNSAVLGVSLTLLDSSLSFAHYLLHLLGAALGFCLIMMVLAGLRERLADADVPRPFAGVAIAVINVGVLSLAFTGFAGMAGP